MTGSVVLALVFWAGLAGALYAYAGFPLIVRLLAARRKAAPDGGAAGAAPVPVTVIIPAYNEERHLDARIRNVLAADYPRALLDVIVVSDASTDGTNRIARAFEAEGVRLIVQERRRGKTAGLNRAMETARGDVVVFTDANASYPAGAIRTLAERLSDPKIGLVTGYTRYASDGSGEVAEVTNLYTRLERLIKVAESRWGCCVGADGAIFAMRRSLYRPLRDDDINDFVLPLHVIERGYHCVFAEEAFCSEAPGAGLDSEFRRQSRITNRTLRALWRNRRLLNPLRFPAFSFFLFSHKVMRFLVPLFLVSAAAALLVLARTDSVYLVLASAAAGALALGAISTLVPGAPVPRPVGVLVPFLAMNLAVLNGWSKFLLGAGDATWQHHRAGGH